tara:strand:+ start:466 stop:1254 length:789 start_codon:yes stop_codon:yes gene_type:complete
MKKVSSTPLSHSDKQERKKEKQIRKEGRRYRETKDTKYLSKIDALQDELDTMRRNRRTNEKLKKAKAEKKTRVVSDDQLFNEARKYNRSLQKEAKKKEKENSEKEEELKDKREEAMKKMKDKKNASIKERAQENEDTNEDKKKEWRDYREDFTEKYREKYPEKILPSDSSCRDLQRQKSNFQKLALKNYRGQLQKAQLCKRIELVENELEKKIEFMNSLDVPEEQKSEMIKVMKELFTMESEDAMSEFSDVIDIAIEDLESI